MGNLKRQQEDEWSAVEDADLLTAMRAIDPRALREFVRRFYPMLVREARHLHVPPSLTDEVVRQALDDAATTLMRRTVPAPRSLAAYVFGTLRNDILNARRDAKRRERRDVGAATEAVDSQWVVAEACSEASLRDSAGPEGEMPTLAPALERLATALDEGLSDDERSLLAWLAHWVPQRLIAEWLGISHGAARVRILRLRERLKDAAQRYSGSLSVAEQQELARFFRRSIGEPEATRDRHADPGRRGQLRSGADANPAGMGDRNDESE